MKRINVLGNFSGRNAGDAAILGCLLEDISSRYENVEFLIPTINSPFVKKEYAGYQVKPVSLLPWNFSVKIFGLPVFRSVMKSNMVLVTDAILFDRKLYNPLFNYLWTLSLVLPQAKSRGIPVILYNCSLGPINSKAGHRCLERILQSADKVILRDKESFELLQAKQLSHPNIFAGADCALNSKAVDKERLRQICDKEGIFKSGKAVFGFNVNSYVDAFIRQDGKPFGRSHLIDIYANSVDRVIDAHDAEVIFVETQHMDVKIAEQVLAAIKRRDRVKLISNKRYGYRDISAVLAKMDIFVGMRTHSLILSSAMGVPPVGIMTYPKNRGYMRTIGLEDHLVAFRDLSADSFFEKIDAVFRNRKAVKEKMIPLVHREKQKASQAAGYLEEYL